MKAVQVLLLCVFISCVYSVRPSIHAIARPRVVIPLEDEAPAVDDNIIISVNSMNTTWFAGRNER